MCTCLLYTSKEEFAALETKLTHNLDHELDRFSKEIKAAIAQEILKRYYFQRGAILQRLKDDPDLKKAKMCIRDSTLTSVILSDQCPFSSVARTWNTYFPEGMKLYLAVCSPGRVSVHSFS